MFTRMAVGRYRYSGDRVYCPAPEDPITRFVTDMLDHVREPRHEDV